MLNIVIVGAGISGLTTAIALRRAGHRVTIYEKSSMNNEVGAAINVPPNATRFLTAWGLDPVQWAFVKGKSVTFKDPFTMEDTMTTLSEDAAMKVGGAHLYYAHRVDLHAALKWLATKEKGEGLPVELKLGQNITGYDPDKPSITVAGEGEIMADLVIGADGVHSEAAEAVVGRSNLPVPPEHHNCCYRFLIPRDVVEADQETRHWNKGSDGVICIMADNPNQRRIIMYPCRDNTVHNFICLFFNENTRDSTTEDWQAGIDKAEVMETFKGYHSDIMKVVGKATEVKRWPLLYRYPLDNWRKGRLILVGDAAHPMLPHMAQGGAQGMEDGCALGIMLHGATTAEDIVRRLELYQDLRIPRASVLQILSNAGQDQVALVQDELRKYLPEDRVPKNPGDIYRNNYGYDIVKESLAVMEREYPGFKLPDMYFESEVLGVPQ